MNPIPPSELIINPDGSIFHLHLRPGQLAEKVILVGDPARVGRVMDHFDRIEVSTANREFLCVTGTCQGQRLTVVSTGIGTDNVDIVLTELDALVNVDFTTRTVKENHTKLWITRLGSCGALQSDLIEGELLLSRTAVGLDGTIRFYADSTRVRDAEMERDLIQRLPWPAEVNPPYVVHASPVLCDLYRSFAVEGITLTAPGFYGAQGRSVRLPLVDPAFNDRLEAYRHRGHRIQNYEMESSALIAMSAMLGHEATAICTVVAQRINATVNTDYRRFVDTMIDLCLEKLVSL